MHRWPFLGGAFGGRKGWENEPERWKFNLWLLLCVSTVLGVPILILSLVDALN